MKAIESKVACVGMDMHLSNCYKVEQMRFRSDLVGSQTQAKSRIHAVFHRHGLS